MVECSNVLIISPIPSPIVAQLTARLRTGSCGNSLLWLVGYWSSNPEVTGGRGLQVSLPILRITETLGKTCFGQKISKNFFHVTVVSFTVFLVTRPNLIHRTILLGSNELPRCEIFQMYACKLYSRTHIRPKLAPCGAYNLLVVILVMFERSTNCIILTKTHSN